VGNQLDIKVALLARKKTYNQNSLTLSCILKVCGIDKPVGNDVLLEHAAGLL